MMNNNKETNRPSILASSVEVGSVFKSASNCVYMVRQSRHNEPGKLELYATGDFVFSLTGTRNKLATYLNRHRYTKVPIVYAQYKINQLSGTMNRNSFVLFLGDHILGKGTENFIGEPIAQEVCLSLIHI